LADEKSLGTRRGVGGDLDHLFDSGDTKRERRRLRPASNDDRQRPGQLAESLRAAGPLAVFRNPLRQMSEAGNGQLMTKMPVLVARGVPVTLSVPDRLQNRVFLYYGLYFGRDGTRSTTFVDSPGFASIEFQPCDAKPRTAWPGGVRIKGRAPVHLNVTVAGSSSPTRLRLGRPRPLD
jgi:hypothetical protein